MEIKVTKLSLTFFLFSILEIKISSIFPEFNRANLDISSTNFINSLFFATKSVSLLTSIIENLFSFSEIQTKPSAAIRSNFLLALAIPFILKNSIDFSISPLQLSIAFLQSLNPTPVSSLNFFTLSNILSGDMKKIIILFFWQLMI